MDYGRGMPYWLINCFLKRRVYYRLNGKANSDENN